MTKPTKWHVRPAKTQISLGIRPVWSESSLSAWKKLGSLATHWVHSEDSDQMPQLIWVFTGRTCHFVGFVMRRLKYMTCCHLFVKSYVMGRTNFWENRWLFLLARLQKALCLDTKFISQPCKSWLRNAFIFFCDSVYMGKVRIVHEFDSGYLWVQTPKFHLLVKCKYLTYQ